MNVKIEEINGNMVAFLNGSLDTAAAAETEKAMSPLNEVEGKTNIVKIFEFYITRGHYYLVTEFCKDGEFFNDIKQKFTENQLAVLFYQVFSGLWYLHDNKILHRDIKLENIMISGKEKDKATDEELFWIKIIDFGTAKIFDKNKMCQEQEKEMEKLKINVEETAKNYAKLEGEYKKAIIDRDNLSSQLIRRNDEVSILHEKIMILTTDMSKSEKTVQEKEEAIKKYYRNKRRQQRRNN